MRPEVEARSPLTGGEGEGSGGGGRAKSRSPEAGGRNRDGGGRTRWKCPLHFRKLVGGRGEEERSAFSLLFASQHPGCQDVKRQICTFSVSSSTLKNWLFLIDIRRSRGDFDEDE